MAFKREARRYASLRSTATDNHETVGKRTLVAGLPASESPVQRREVIGAVAQVGTQDVQAAAARGVATASSALPHHATIQQLFGRHDISGIQAHTGPGAAASARAMGAEAYTTGHHVVLGGAGDLHTVAHEAAHVVQQRGGVHLKGGVGEANDAYERHADQVADLVVRGQSAESLLSQVAGNAGPSDGVGAPVQRKVSFDDGKTVEPFIPPEIEQQATCHGFDPWRALTQWHFEGKVHTEYKNWEDVLAFAIASTKPQGGKDTGGENTKKEGGEQRNTNNNSNNKRVNLGNRVLPLSGENTKKAKKEGGEQRNTNNKRVNLGNRVLPLSVVLPDEYASNVNAQRVLEAIQATGADVSKEVQNEISKLDQLTLHWLYNAMEVVREVTHDSQGTLAAHYEKLYNARTNPSLLQAHDTGENLRFERQVLALIGWFKTTMTGAATPPQGEKLKVLSNTYNPPPQRDDPDQSVLRETEFRDKMSKAMVDYLNSEYEKSTSAKQVNDVGTLANLADHIQEIAHACFAPFVGKTIASQDLAGFKYSQNVHDLEEEKISDSVIESYLQNRAAAVGTTTTTIWVDTNFDGSDPLHLAVLKEVLQPLAQQKAHLIEILRATPRNDDGVVHISRRIAPDADLYLLRWQNLYTLCHEYMHTLAHPDFSAAAARIGHPQIVTEGFPEALAYELKVSLLGAARRDPQFKALMEKGVPEGQRREPPAPPLDYGGAAMNAFDIIRTVGPLNARGAFFLGAVELVGLAPDQKLDPETAKTEGQPVRIVEHHKTFPADPGQQEDAFAQETQGKGFGSEPLHDIRKDVDGIANVQVVRAHVEDTYRDLIAWMRDHHYEDTPKEGNEDFDQYKHVRDLIGRYPTEHEALWSRVNSAQESPTRSDVLRLLRDLVRYADGYLQTHDKEGASTVKPSEWWG